MILYNTGFRMNIHNGRSKFSCFKLFLDFEPEVRPEPPQRGSLDHIQKELLHCCQRRKNETVFEFLAVGNRRIAVLLYIVKGGVNSQISSFFSSFIA